MFGKFRDQSRYLFRWMLLWALALGALTALYGMPSRFYLSVGVVAFTGFALMLLSWYLLLGPTWFAAVWMPVLLSGWWLYAVANYHTHLLGVDGATMRWISARDSGCNWPTGWDSGSSIGAHITAMPG